MTWREFRLRVIGREKAKKEQWYHTRLIAYYTYLSIPIKGKHVSIDKFMALDDKIKGGASDEAMASLREAQEKAMAEALNQTL